MAILDNGYYRADNIFAGYAVPRVAAGSLADYNGGGILCGAGTFGPAPACPLLQTVVMDRLPELAEPKLILRELTVFLEVVYFAHRCVYTETGRKA